MAEVGAPSRSKAFGFIVMVGLVVALLLVGSIPVLVGILVGSIEPLGELRENVTPASLGHLVWIVPALYVVSSATDAVARTVFPQHKRRQLVLAIVVTWLSLVAVLSVFVAGAIASMIGSVIATALYMASAHFLERAGEKVAKRQDG